MTPHLPVSVIVVSRDRPDALVRCLTAIAQLDHPCFEVVVVAPQADQANLRDLPFKSVLFDFANISAARNAGLAAAAGEVVAFIDDDAVPEPTWLSRLTAPFGDTEVVVATGFVRGRNGISFQSRAATIDHLGETHPLPVSDDPTLVPLTAGTAGTAGTTVKAVGTNSAFRKTALCRIGGFDPAFRFYLDDADLSIRLAANGGTAAIVPDAQVHHGYAASARRRSDRTPTDLTDIGASVAVYLRKHASHDPLGSELALRRLRADQRARLIRHMVAGRIEPRDVGIILATLETGLAEGRTREIPPVAAVTPTGLPFLPAPTRRQRGLTLSGRIWQARRLRRAAASAAAGGHIVTLFLLAPTSRRHRILFNSGGYWEQRGGLFGRSDRSDSAFQWFFFRQRVYREATMAHRFRPIQDR